MVLAECSTFTMERLWGFPDWQPEPAHKARSGPARGNSTVGRMQGGYGLAPRTLPLWRCKWGQCLNGSSWNKKTLDDQNYELQIAGPWETLLVHLGRSQRSQKEEKKTERQPMFGRGNVKLEATITIDISKTGAFLSPLSVCCVSVRQVRRSALCSSTWWSYPPLIIRHFILPEPNLTNRGHS